jgi:hypothetical protein
MRGSKLETMWLKWGHAKGIYDVADSFSNSLGLQKTQRSSFPGKTITLFLFYSTIISRWHSKTAGDLGVKAASCQ